MTRYSYALFITGNPGCGKSFIANLLGADFVSGFGDRGGGVTTHIQKASVYINGETVLLIDAPGLIEVDFEKTKRNAVEITKALEISKNTPFKIGVIVTDHNGRIQLSDLLLIQKVDESLTPKFEMLLIVNQIKKRNMKNYQTTDCLNSLVRTIHASTGADLRIDRVIAIADLDEGDHPSITPLTNMLGKIDEKSSTRVNPISVTREELKSLGEKIVFFVYKTLEFLVTIASAVVVVGHIII